MAERFHRASAVSVRSAGDKAGRLRLRHDGSTGPTGLVQGGERRLLRCPPAFPALPGFSQCRRLIAPTARQRASRIRESATVHRGGLGASDWLGGTCRTERGHGDPRSRSISTTASYCRRPGRHCPGYVDRVEIALGEPVGKGDRVAEMSRRCSRIGPLQQHSPQSAPPAPSSGRSATVLLVPRPKPLATSPSGCPYLAVKPLQLHQICTRANLPRQSKLWPVGRSSGCVRRRERGHLRAGFSRV